jgi:hypothetical protein
MRELTAVRLKSPDEPRATLMVIDSASAIGLAQEVA